LLLEQLDKPLKHIGLHDTTLIHDLWHGVDVIGEVGPFGHYNCGGGIGMRRRTRLAEFMKGVVDRNVDPIKPVTVEKYHKRIRDALQKDL
jgi:hypothetical protein